MATRRTAKKTAPAKKDSVLIAVGGSAEISQESFDELVNDYTEGKDVVLVLPITKDHWTPAVECAVAWAKDNEVAYDAVIDETTKGRGIKGAADNAASTEKSTDVVQTLVGIVAGSEEDSAVLLLAWDEDDDLTYSMLEAAEDAEVETLNLTDGLEPLSFDEDGSDDGDGDGDGDEDDDKVGGFTREEAGEWPLRKIRAWALDKDIHGKKALTSDKTSNMSKPELLDHFFGPDEDGDDGEPEKPAEKATSSRRGRGSRASQRDEEPSEDDGEGDDTGGRSEDDEMDAAGVPRDEGQALLPFVARIDGWVSEADALNAIKVLQKWISQGDKNPPGRPRKDAAPAGTKRTSRSK